MEEPTLLHADVDSFFASVEQRDDPRLRGRPVIVGGGVVLAASYEAKAYGVRTAMGGRQARRLCPHAIVVSPRFSEYSAASRAMFRVFEDTTPRVEGLSIDEAFLDVRGLARLSGSSTDIAVRLRREVRERVGLPITVGVARTKFLAKVASGVAKPDGLLVVPPEGELAFLHPLPVECLWGVGAATAEKLHARGITTVADVAGSRSRPSWPCSGGRRDGTCMPSPTTATRVRCSPAGGGARSDRSAPSGGRRAPSRPSTWCSSGWWTASPGACGRPAGSAARSSCACASMTSRGPRAPTPCPSRRPTRPPSWPRPAACWQVSPR